MMTTNPDSITEDDVVTYLEHHPEFFQEHLNLLETMHIPHPSGTATSLISKQLERFRQKQHKMETQLASLMTIARENDHSFNRLHKLTLALLKANTLEKVISNLQQALAEFFNTDLIAIHFIQEPATDQTLADFFIAPDDSRLRYFEKELGSSQPFCGIPSTEQADFLFEERAAQVRSCAIIPMVYPRIRALIGIGHTEEEGFHSDMGNIFLKQISEIAATRLISLRPATDIPASHSD